MVDRTAAGRAAGRALWCDDGLGVGWPGKVGPFSPLIAVANLVFQLFEEGKISEVFFGGVPFLAPEALVVLVVQAQSGEVSRDGARRAVWGRRPISPELGEGALAVG